MSFSPREREVAKKRGGKREAGGRPAPSPPPPATSGGGGRRLRTVVVLAAVVAVAATSLGMWTMLRPPELRRDPGLSVLLVTIDTLRADALGCYGRRAAATPWVDRLADSGVRFEEARAQNVVTLPSHATILSGRLPLEHGVRDPAQDERAGFG